MAEKLRVLYKKTGKPPQIKIINDIFQLKNVIVKRKLSIMRYETVFMICQKGFVENAMPNLILTFQSIFGDLILVKIDREKREFESLSQEEIGWYFADLLNKSPKMRSKKYE